MQTIQWRRGVAPALAGVALLLAGCRTPVLAPLPTESAAAPSARGSRAPVAIAPSLVTPVLPPAGSGRGGYYLDDGPGDAPPPNLEAVPDAAPRVEPYSSRGNRPYVVFGKTYTPVTDNLPMIQRGTGSWYGKKFHGQKTSSGELYDMYKMSAAHPTLPIPSYARVTNLKNGRQVIVRVNDRGPFHSSRIIDLSYTAALKLGYIGHGSAELEVERLLPDDIARINNAARAETIALKDAAATPQSALPPAQSVLDLPPAPPVAQVPPIKSTAALSLDEFLAQQGAPAQPATMPAAASAFASIPALAPTLTVAALIPDAGPEAILTPGFYLQFGAYAQSANAEQLRQQLLQQWPQGLPLPVVHQGGAVVRLYSGPFSNRAEALQAAARLADRPLMKPLIVQR
jgi:rare lipoprotein A